MLDSFTCTSRRPPRPSPRLPINPFPASSLDFWKLSLSELPLVIDTGTGKVSRTHGHTHTRTHHGGYTLLFYIIISII